MTLSTFSNLTMTLVSRPYDTNVTAEQPWVNTKFSFQDSDVEVRSTDGFIFQLHRVVLGVTTGAFPVSDIDTGGEMVELTEPANVLEILFAFLYPKAHPDLHGVSYEILVAVAKAAGKYDIFSAVNVCNERLMKFLPQYAPEILIHAVKHDYPRLISATLPHFARAPFLPVLEKLPPSYMVLWARYHEAWKMVFKESVLYIKNLRESGNTVCHSSSHHSPGQSICKVCAASLNVLIAHLEEIDAWSTLHDTLRSPNTKYLKSVLTCCRHNNNHDSRGYQKLICPFVEEITELCQSKIDKIPSFATFIGLEV